MANTNVVVDVPLIAKKARDAGNAEPFQQVVTLPDGSTVTLIIYIFGTPRAPLQGGGSCNGICW